MKQVNIFVAFLLLCITACKTTKSYSSQKFYDNYSKKNASKALGEFANVYTRTKGSLGLKYRSSGGKQMGGAQFIDLQLSPEDSKGEIYINDVLFTRAKVGIDPSNKTYQFCFEDCDFYNSVCHCEEDQTRGFYGHDVTLKYLYDGEKRLEEYLYVPKLINVNFPTNTSAENLRTTISRSNFLIEWNADFKNKYGVIIAVASTYGDHNEKRMKKTIKVEDSGSYKLPVSLFEDIPEKSNILIEISRGRYPIVKDYRGDIYRLNFSSEFSDYITII